MRKKLIFILVLVSLLAVFVTTAAAPVGITRVTLVETVYLREKGVTFRFQMEGNASRNLLQGTITFDGITAKLRCKNNHNGQVICTAPGGTAKHAGASGYVTLAGFSFPVVIPARIYSNKQTRQLVY
jgi:hypothetical protein